MYTKHGRINVIILSFMCFTHFPPVVFAVGTEFASITAWETTSYTTMASMTSSTSGTGSATSFTSGTESTTSSTGDNSATTSFASGTGSTTSSTGGTESTTSFASGTGATTSSTGGIESTTTSYTTMASTTTSYTTMASTTTSYTTMASATTSSSVNTNTSTTSMMNSTTNSTISTTSSTPSYTTSVNATYRYRIQSNYSLAIGIVNNNNVIASVQRLITNSFVATNFDSTVLQVNIQQQAKALQDYNLDAFVQFRTTSSCSISCIDNSRRTPNTVISLLTDNGTPVDVTVRMAPNLASPNSDVVYPIGGPSPGLPAQLGMGLGISFFFVLLIGTTVILYRKFGLSDSPRMHEFATTRY